MRASTHPGGNSASAPRATPFWCWRMANPWCWEDDARQIMDKHTLAWISIIGSSLDVLGALYLAYDLLGGEHGPLRTLTRAVTYGLLFGGGFGAALGPVFGLV